MMKDYQINICEDILAGREIQNEEDAASAIAAGFVLKRNGDLFVTVPAFTKAQYEQFKTCAESAFTPVIKAYAEAVKAYIAGCRKLFPAHLEDEVSIACSYTFLSLYATVVCGLAIIDAPVRRQHLRCHDSKIEGSRQKQTMLYHIFRHENPRKFSFGGF